MKSLYDAFVGKQEPDPEPILKPSTRKTEDFESLTCPESQTIIQIHRKIKLLNEFKDYIDNADKNSVYYKYIINTEIYEYYGPWPNYYRNVYVISNGLFGGLEECITTVNSESIFFGLIMD